jgi:uncharacterized protein YndB with AHSA1/START domain
MNKQGDLRIATPTDREVVMTRTFNAPRQLVFDALTKPELLRKWYGPKGWDLVVCEVDLRVGGAWRFVSQRENGKNIGQYGVYTEIVVPSRIVNTELWEDWDAGETLAAVNLIDLGGRTLYECTTLFPSREVRDSILKSGLEPGAAETFDRLEELLISARVK